MTALRLRLWATPRLRAAIPTATPPLALGGLIVLACVERVRSSWRRRRGARPRVIWGPSPILNNKYGSESIERRGYETRTAAIVPLSIGRRGDFDRHRDEFPNDYAMFAWALRHGDVFVMFFDLGFLRVTPLRWRELWLLRLAGKKTVVTAFGGDAAVAGELGDFEELLFTDYPDLPSQADATRQRVDHTLEWADVSVRTHGPVYQPRHDVISVTLLGMDTDAWSDRVDATEADGRSGEVVVVHAPNHRHIKGTRHLEQAVAELREDGLDIRLEIFEGRGNEEVREAMLACDIVADQFVLGYALFAVEGMACGKPVLSNLSRIPARFRETEQLRSCPIMDTGPESLREDLRRLVEDPALRAELGRAGRQFAMRYHSYEAMGRIWEDIVEFAWNGRALPPDMAP